MPRTRNRSGGIIEPEKHQNNTRLRTYPPRLFYLYCSVHIRFFNSLNDLYFFYWKFSRLKSGELVTSVDIPALVISFFSSSFWNESLWHQKSVK